MQWFLSIFTDNPAIRLTQIMLLCGAVVSVYLVFYATRDILLRTKSFGYQVLCILLTAALPVLGFFLYLLIRPARTVKERETERMLKEFLSGRKKGKSGQKDCEDCKECKETETIE